MGGKFQTESRKTELLSLMNKEINNNDKNNFLNHGTVLLGRVLITKASIPSFHIPYLLPFFATFRGWLDILFDDQISHACRENNDCTFNIEIEIKIQLESNN